MDERKPQPTAFSFKEILERGENTDVARQGQISRQRDIIDRLMETLLLAEHFIDRNGLDSLWQVAKDEFLEKYSEGKAKGSADKRVCMIPDCGCDGAWHA